jgi:hypothetical protein
MLSRPTPTLATTRSLADRGGGDPRPARQDRDRIVPCRQLLDLGRRRRIGGPGDQAEPRALDNLALDRVVRPRAVGEQDLS